MGDHKQSKSWISKFTNFQSSLHRWHILLQHKQITYQVTTVTLTKHKQNTYHITTFAITAQTGHLPSNMSSPRFSSEVPWWKYFPENPKLNRKPGTSCWIRCCVAKIACRHKESVQITSLQHSVTIKTPICSKTSDQTHYTTCHDKTKSWHLVKGFNTFALLSEHASYSYFVQAATSDNGQVRTQLKKVLVRGSCCWHTSIL